MAQLVKNTRVKAFVMGSGERYCLLFDAQTRHPLYYPNLYVTTQVRNNSLSLAAMETALNRSVSTTLRHVA